MSTPRQTTPAAYATRLANQLAEGQKRSKVKHFMHVTTPSARQHNWRRGPDFPRKSWHSEFSGGYLAEGGVRLDRHYVARQLWQGLPTVPVSLMIQYRKDNQTGIIRGIFLHLD